MAPSVFYSLIAILAMVLLGWVLARTRWLQVVGGGRKASMPGEDSFHMLAQVAFYVCSPALLFRTTARLDLSALPLQVMVAYFLPAMLWLGLVYAAARWMRQRARGELAQPAAPGVLALSLSFGNTLYLGIPLASALFGEKGLGLHIALISVHALLLFSSTTALIERDLARHAPAGSHAHRWQAAGNALRNTLLHPVVLPVLVGLVWNTTGWGLHPVLDEVLRTLSGAVVPLCLLLIGFSLAQGGVKGHWLQAWSLAMLKLLLLPALVLGVAHGVFGLQGLPLQVVVVAAALPVGNNALLFARRYNTLQAVVAATIVLSTAGFVFTLPLWLGVLAWVG
jgi:malonate transporter